MKTNFIYAGTIGTLLMLAVIILIVIIKSRKNANKTAGRLLDGRDIQGRHLDFLDCERPFVERFEGFN